MALPLGALIGGVTSLANIGIGLGQRAKASRLQRGLSRPTQTVQSEFFKNAAEAEQMAKTGMSSQQYNNALNNIRSSSMSGFRQLGRMGKTGGLASIVRAQNDATLGLDARDAEMRRQNRFAAMQQRGILGGQKQAAWNWNKRDAYGEKLAEIQALRGSGAQNIGNGLGAAANLGMIMSQGQDFSLGSGDDNTMGGNFSPNSVNLFGKLLGKNRQTFIGNRPLSAGFGIKQSGITPVNI